MPIKGRKRKGTSAEWKSRDYLEARGYRVLRCAGSFSEWDLIAFLKKNWRGRTGTWAEILLVQVKSSRWPGSKEMKAMRDFPAPANCAKHIHRWQPRYKEPEVRFL